MTTGDGGRLDLVAYDADESKRLIIESKFWAALLSGQASGYVQQLASDGRPATLLFVAPEVRRETLWAKIEGQFSQRVEGQLSQGVVLRLGEARQEGRVKVADVRVEVAEVADTGPEPGCPPQPRWRVALTSWHALLNRLESADSSMAANIRQLRSLASAEDDKAFAPLHADEFDPAIPRRHLDFCRIVDDVVDTGEHDLWISLKGMRAAAQRDGYLRYFQFRSSNGNRTSRDIALYFSASRWAKSGATPIWLHCWHKPEQEALGRQTGIEYEKDPGGPGWIPLRLLMGVEYSDVLADVLAQVKRVRDIVLDDAARRAGASGADDSVDEPLAEVEVGEPDSGAE